jgi:plasmid stabilization system protein ParE
MPNKIVPARVRGAAGRVVRPAKNRKSKIIRTTGRRWSDTAEQRFLAHLAATANVLAAAAEAGFSTTAIYRRRMMEPGFAQKWQMALETGIARIEMQLVECASSSLAGDDIPLDKPTPRMTPTEVMNLIKLHRAAVMGGRPQRYDWRLQLPDIETVRADVLRKIKALKGKG